jgi:hypothetical protein
MSETLSLIFAIGVVLTMLFLSFVFPEAIAFYIVIGVIGCKAMYMES